MYKQAFSATMGHEGGYSNHVSDTGGETFMGISRKYNPDWNGWSIVDNYIYKEKLNDNTKLISYVRDFYEKSYWNTPKLNLERLSEQYPQVACELFDVAVNMGTTRAARFLQRALNILNRDEKNYDDLQVDGFCGNVTFNIIDKYSGSEMYLRKMIILLKAKFYIDLVERNETQEVFIRGWINRINL